MDTLLIVFLSVFPICISFIKSSMGVGFMSFPLSLCVVRKVVAVNI